MNTLLSETEPECSSKFARSLGLTRCSLYAQPTRLAARDKDNIAKLKACHEQEPRYGVRRLALMLHWSHNKTRRIRTLAGIQAYTPQRRNRGRTKLRPEIEAPENRLRHYYIYRKTDPPEKLSAGRLARGMMPIWSVMPSQTP